MTRVRREDIVDYQTYGDEREAFRRKVMAAKEARRVHLGQHMTFLFENHDTVRYQVQEMIRAERIVRESDISHELETYNELLGGPGEIGATVLIEYDDPQVRDVMLRKLVRVMDYISAKLEDGRDVAASFDSRQIGDDRLSSVQFIKFKVGGSLPVSLRCRHPDYNCEVTLTPAQQQALRADLGL